MVVNFTRSHRCRNCVIFVLKSSVNSVHHGSCCNSSCVVHSGAGSRNTRDKYRRTASVRKNAKGFGLATSNFCEASFNACKTASYGSMGLVGFSFFAFPRCFRFSKNHKPTADKTTKSATIHGNRETFNFAGGRRSRISPRSCGSSSSGVGAALFAPEPADKPRGMFAGAGSV